MLVYLSCFFLVGVSSADGAVCYGKYGCFNRQPPFNNWLVWLPRRPSAIGTTFDLYTRSNRGNAKIIDDTDEEKLKGTNFNISKRTIVIIHGYFESKHGYLDNNWIASLKDALLEREDCNVILVDWSRGATFPYMQASGNARLVGVQIAELIRFLISSSSGCPDLADRFYIVGFSLGAQVAGYAGAHLLAHGMVLGRITGLDPAGPYFSYTDPATRLDPGDARFVDVIHTDAGLLGTSQKVGHIDFFPNGGARQPGCYFSFVDLIKSISCDHYRAPYFYIATVKNLSRCPWRAYPCKSNWDFRSGNCLGCFGDCPAMGYNADHTKQTGVFYIKTNKEAPFCVRVRASEHEYYDFGFSNQSCSQSCRFFLLLTSR